MKTDVLTDKQRLAIPVLLRCPSKRAAAAELGLAERQIYAWAQQPTFKAEMTRQREELIADAVDKLRSGLVKAADVLLDALDSPDERTRVKVANDVFALVSKFWEQQEMSGRLAALETRSGGK